MSLLYLKDWRRTNLFDLYYLGVPIFPVTSTVRKVGDEGYLTGVFFTLTKDKKIILRGLFRNDIEE